MITAIGWIVIIGIAIFIALAYDKGVNKKRQESKAKYEEAKRSGDKAKALEMGRKYYASLRFSGRLTIYDEQAITNDLSAM